MILLHQLVLALQHAVTWLQHVGVLPPPGVEAAGFLAAIWAIVAAIGSAVAAVAQWVADAGVLVFKSIGDVAKFAAKGVVWITAHIRAGFANAYKWMDSFITGIPCNLERFWFNVSGFFTKVKGWLQPITDWLHTVQTTYDKYFRDYVQPVLNVITRVRQALVIFKMFHLQWAQTLDGWLNDVQQQIIKNTLWLHQKLTEVIGWVNSVGDPYGFLKYWPMLGGFVNGIDSFWLAITGSRFFGSIGAPGSVSATAHASAVLAQQVAEIDNKTGDAGDMFDRAPTQHAALYSEMGIPGAQ
jgi:hypothetical protein